MRLFALLIALAGPVAADPGTDLATAAEEQVGVTVIYDPAYVGLEFPGGDLPRERGVCSDVVIRALRDAWGIDLQAVVNADMKANFSAYPKIWGLKTTDRNIDHRRVPNLETLFTRAGAALPLSSDLAAFHPGDIVSFRLTGSNLPHIGIIAEGIAPDGTPLVTHNIGSGTRTENMLFDHPMQGHFRLSEPARAWLAAR
ncbi:DUF1287 domain-containing protein [Vannielia litorea]|uniref:DUF1287 domain-containing protein n=1 Tax=Vannielia litorea TaxID=1217970 RepID=UPI001BCD6F4F|nr:DUF1287 domain-containing protein [Vannielia litorea]MBS8228854.1 DUF1287 domain-containing protein [Vannielia litorea]